MSPSSSAVLYLRCEYTQHVLVTDEATLHCADMRVSLLTAGYSTWNNDG